MSEFFAGLDLGQSNDPSALSIVQKMPSTAPGARAMYECRYLKRLPLNMSYSNVVSYVKNVLERPELLDKVALVIDFTGVGRVVADIFRSSGLRCPLHCVSVTGGDAVARDGFWWRVPKRELISSAQILLQDRRLLIAKDLKDAPTLTQELIDYRVKINVNGNDTYEPWRTTAHDDLLFSLCLATWMDTRPIRVQAA